MNIFVTGIAGFLGSHISENMIIQGNNVSGNDTLKGGYKCNIPKKAKFYNIDCTDFKKMNKVLKNVDILYHCAAHPYEGLSVFSPSLVTNSISQATASTLSAFINNKGKRFIYCSSMARYGMNQVPFTEDMEPRPQDPYAIAKVASEELIKLMSRVHNFEYNIVIPHNIYGERQKYDDPYRNVVAIFINRMLQNKQPIIYGDGKQTRCFSNIRDVINPLIKLADSNIYNETINIGPDKEWISIYNLAKTISDCLNIELNPIYLPDRPQEVKDANCSADKARRLLNYETKIKLEEGCNDMINWIRKIGIKKFNYYINIEINNEKTPKTWRDKLI